ncbi:MAG: hypothetical protein JO262_19700 [Solirubrobacterales bacterium]|nr:hypothetical protein [Solirubrobacterales bacterium]MBV9944364.1 hypothetical protein [Solirubrobacterales bacterium]
MAGSCSAGGNDGGDGDCADVGQLLAGGEHHIVEEARFGHQNLRALDGWYAEYGSDHPVAAG